MVAVVPKVKRRLIVCKSPSNAVIRKNNRFHDTGNFGPDFQKLLTAQNHRLDNVFPLRAKNHELLFGSAVKDRKATHI